jgi:hypothetical protein
MHVAAPSELRVGALMLSLAVAPLLAQPSPRTVKVPDATAVRLSLMEPLNPDFSQHL